MCDLWLDFLKVSNEELILNYRGDDSARATLAEDRDREASVNVKLAGDL